MATPGTSHRPKEKQHDETPSNIVDHPFVPRGEWYTLCLHCGLAESAHKETTLPRYYADDALEDD